MPHIIINRLKIYYEVNGSGPPIVLIPGIGANISENRTIIDSLSKRFKVIALDNRDSGKSEQSRERYSIEAMARDVRMLMEKLKIRRASVIGISMGGRIALSLAFQSPEKIDKLILVSTFPGRKKWMKIYLPLLMLKPLKIVHTHLGKNPQNRLALSRQFRATIAFEATSLLSSLNIPVTVMHGSKDKRVRTKNAELMKHSIKNASLIYFRGGHLFFKKRNQEFIQAVSKSLL